MYVRSWFLYVACVTSFTSSSAEARPERAAIVVGANGAAPGRQALRYAHEDADSVATVLQEVGGFLPEDVHLLHDPTPDELLSSLDEGLARAEASPGSIVLFYYSGHSDEAAIYPSGRRLDLSALKTRLSDSRAEVRIGIIDACRGGEWTGAKGLVEEDPFSLDLAEPPSSEGTILIASSAGRESAHEAERVAGSFFTHHLVAGLRGAADTNDDARVTVTEAYAYARERTIRDAAIYAAEPQNPSFAMSLKGRQDVLLAEIDRAPSRLRIEGPSASLEIIHVDTGTRVVETSSTDGRLTLALPPGRYLVRTRDASPRRVREFRLSAGHIVALEDADLIAVGSDRLALKGNGVEGRLLASPRSARPTVAGGYGEISLALGVRHEEMSGLSVDVRRDVKGLIHATWGLGGGWTWTLPGYLAWSVGGEDSMQIVGSFGVTGFGVGWGSSDGLLGSLSLGAGLDVRTALGRGHNLVMGLRTHGAGQWSEVRTQPMTTWRGSFHAGYTTTVSGLVTLSFGAKVGANWLEQRDFSLSSERADPTIALGSVLSVGGRSLPLVQVHLTDAFSLDGIASVTVGETLEETYMLGATFNF